MPFSRVFFQGFSNKFCGFLRFSTLFSKVFSRVFSRKLSSMRSARTSFFCSFLMLYSHSGSVPVEAFGFPDFQRKMLTHLPCFLLPILRRYSFLSVLAFCKWAGGGFWVPRCSKKNLIHLPCSLLPTLRRARSALPLETRTWFSHAHNSAARFRQNTRAQNMPHSRFRCRSALANKYMGNILQMICLKFRSCNILANKRMDNALYRRAISTRLDIKSNDLRRLFNEEIVIMQFSVRTTIFPY